MPASLPVHGMQHNAWWAAMGRVTRSVAHLALGLHAVAGQHDQDPL
jgi:hypothetical protein